MTCLKSWKRTLEPSKTKHPLGKHPNYVMPYNIIPRYGIGAQQGTTPIPEDDFGKLTKSGVPGWFLNEIGYLFFRDGARLRTSAKRLHIAFWRLNPLRLVCAQHPKPFFRCFTPQNRANDGARKVLSTNNPILVRNTPGISCPVIRLDTPPDFVHAAPDFVHTAPDFVQFCKTRGDTETDISPQPSTEDLWPKIFNTTGKLPTVTTVMQPQQHKDPP